MNGASPSSNSTASTAGRLRLVVRQLLDVLKRVPIKPIPTERSLDKSPAPLEALLVAQRRGLGSRGCAQNRMFHDPRVAPEHDENWIGEACWELPGGLVEQRGLSAVRSPGGFHDCLCCS